MGEVIDTFDFGITKITEKIIVERNEKMDSAILGEIQKIATEEGIVTKIVLNKKNVADALRNYQDGYATVKAEVARGIIADMRKLINGYENIDIYLVELKKKYLGGDD